LFAKNSKYAAEEINIKRSGKWMLFCPRTEVDEKWDKVKESIKHGDLWSAKVSTCGDNYNHVIIIYTRDYSDVTDVINVLDYLELSELKPPQTKIYYKTDEQTRAGIYTGGGEQPWMYESRTIREILPSRHEPQGEGTLASKHQTPGLPLDVQLLEQIWKNDPLLTELNLSYKKLKGDRICQLAEALRYNTTVVSLDVSHNQIGMLGAQLLAQITTLTSLNLHGNKICYKKKTNKATLALSQNTTLLSLDIGATSINDETLLALAKHPRLTSLAASHCSLSIESATALAANLQLISLNVFSNQFKDEGAQKIAISPALQYLNIYKNDIGLPGALALAQSTLIQRLEIGGNHIEDEGARALLENRVLVFLDLTKNGLSPVCLETFSLVASLTRLRELNLRRNRIGDRGVESVASFLSHNSTLTNLKLYECGIGMVGAQCLAKVLHDNTTLTELDLGNNDITNEGGDAFLEMFPSNKTLVSLSLIKKQFIPHPYTSLQVSNDVHSQVQSCLNENKSNREFASKTVASSACELLRYARQLCRPSFLISKTVLSILGFLDTKHALSAKQVQNIFDFAQDKDMLSPTVTRNNFLRNTECDQIYRPLAHYYSFFKKWPLNSVVTSHQEMPYLLGTGPRKNNTQNVDSERCAYLTTPLLTHVRRPLQ
jgi:Leucine-rich repeat (LRR) protein